MVRSGRDFYGTRRGHCRTRTGQNRPDPVRYGLVLCWRTALHHLHYAAAGRQMLDVPDEPEVFDMTEALHLAGMITQALDATVTVGRTGNEVNETVLPAPLPAGNTNGRINLWRESALNSSSPEA